MNTLMNDRSNDQPHSLEARVSELERELQALKASLGLGSLREVVEADEQGSATGSLVTPKWIGHTWLKERIESREIRSEERFSDLLKAGSKWMAEFVPVEGAVYPGIKLRVVADSASQEHQIILSELLRKRLLDFGISSFGVGVANKLNSTCLWVELFSPEAWRIPLKVRAAIVGERAGVEVKYFRVEGKLIFQPVDLMDRPINPVEFGQPHWRARVRDAGFVWDDESMTFSEKD